MLYPFFKVLCQIIFLLTGGIKVYGKENILKKGPFVLIANHQSIIDPLVLMACLPRKITFLAASYLFKIPIVGLIIWAGGAIPINDPKGDFKHIQRALAKLEDGEAIGIFLEGGVSLDGKLKEFMPGWAYFALKSGAPIIPVAISGSRKVLPVGHYLLRPGKIVVNIGEPILMDKKTRIRSSDLKKLNESMEKIVFRLLYQVERKRG